MNALQRDLKNLVPLVESLGAEKAASDPHRQKFHIQPMVGWLNDPNGLCKIGDTYHAFFQYGPFDVSGGVKHWGHVTSRDLLHWDYQPTMRRLLRLGPRRGRHDVPVLHRQRQVPWGV